MSTFVHVIDVGQGNMVLIQTDDRNHRRVYVFDCNITEENKSRVLQYVKNAIGQGGRIDAFICSHRDADHMRGVTDLHTNFPISQIWDSGYSGTTTTSNEYMQYMALRRTIGSTVLENGQRLDFNITKMRFLSAADRRLEKNPNAQGIVIKIEHHSNGVSSVMLPADSDAETWNSAIMKDYGAETLKSSILMAGHHGSISFFEDATLGNRRYEDHMRAIQPAMTIVSVGKNSHGHPDPAAIDLYEKHSSGSSIGTKVLRTDKNGTIKIELKDGGNWNISRDR